MESMCNYTKTLLESINSSRPLTRLTSVYKTYVYLHAITHLVFLDNW